MDRSNRDLLERLITVGSAVVIATTVILFVKKVLLPSVSSNAGDEIWMLEAVVVLTIVGAFLYQEIMEGMQRVLRALSPRRTPEPSPGKGDRISPMLLIISLGASVAIYLAARLWLAGMVGANS